MKALLLPHPVLLPNGSDYKDGRKFDMTVGKPQHTMDGKILVSVHFVLESAFVKRLIAKNRAKIFVIVQCAKTYKRKTYTTEGMEMELHLPLVDYVDKITLSPHIASTEPIKPFRSTEHHGEFRGITIDVPAGAILARGSDTDLTIDSLQTLGAAIQLLTNNDLEKGEYRIDVSEDYVKIYMHEETRCYVEFLRKSNRSNLRMLYQSVYMVALTHAMQHIADDADRKWAEALKKTLDANNIKIDDLKDNAYKYAQQLLKYPLKRDLERDAND